MQSRLRRAVLETVERRLLLASVSGTVFNDLNGDGTRQSNEQGLAGWGVFVDFNRNGTLDQTVSGPLASTDVPKAITDNAVASSVLSVSGIVGPIADINVFVNLTHTYTNDLTITLVSPTGTRVNLADRVGGSGDNYTNTVFDDEATSPIAAGSPPFTGTFRPAQALSAFDGQDANGTWRLEVNDQASIDTGSLLGWSITVTTGETVITTDASGNYTVANVPAGTIDVVIQPDPLFDLITPASGRHTITLGAATAATADFAVREKPGEIAGLVWSDYNNNGSRDSGEPGIAGWTVYLDLNRNDALDSGEPTAVTNASGEYLFTGVAPGSYVIAQVIPAGWVQTSPGGPASVIERAVGPAKQQLAAVDPMSEIERAFSRLAFEYSQTDLPATATSWLVWLKPNADIKGFSANIGASEIVATGFIDNVFAVTLDSPALADSALRAGGLDVIRYAIPMESRQQTPRAIPNDPRFGSQWHLRNTGQRGGTPGQDINVVGVWDSITGNGVTIGVVDDGLQRDHPDLAPNYVAAYSFDFNNNDPDPRPESTFDDHGTAVAGVAGAKQNDNYGVSGAAPNASLAGLRLISGPSTDLMEANALSYFKNNIDIYTNSWGPYDDAARIEAPGPLTLAAFQSVVNTGRNGLGGIYTWAAGNGLTSNDNVNYDGYASSRYTIAVTAIDDQGRQSYYAEPGASTLIAAYSSGRAGITTTDVFNTFTDSFGGTSSATPLAAGVIALMLEANPNLTWRDVQHVLVNSARKNDPTDSDWLTNAAGHDINHKYGFGVVDAAAAVATAQSWVNVGPEVSATSGVLAVNAPIPDNGAAVVRTFDVPDAIKLESVEVVFNATHASRGQLEVVLISPTGTRSVLAERHSDTGDNYVNWTFTSVRHWDELSNGTWTIEVRDRTAGTTGTFNNWTLNLYGTQANTRVHFTNVRADQTVSGLNFGNHDVAAPNLLQANFNFDAASPVLELSFDEPVILDASQLVLTNTDTNTVVPAASLAVSFVSPTQAVVSFAGFANAVLPDGNYRLEVAGTVADASGNAIDQHDDYSFHVLAGDADRDHDVDFQDLLTLARNFGQSGKTFSEGNFDYSAGGDVGFSDMLMLARNYGVSLFATRPISSKPASTATGEKKSRDILA